MVKYLYGAAVQGIQNYIFATNKLKEIVLRSDLVERICTEAFNEFAGSNESILRAAGNIKHVFDKEEDCRKAVLEFPKKVMIMAPGIAVSQAVVEFEGDDYGKKANELESRLRIQRNIPARSMTLGMMGIHRNQRTGLPARGEVTEQSIDKLLLDKKCFGFDLESDACTDSMTSDGKNNWLAVIHADGNSLGQIVQKIAPEGSEVMRKFSTGLDKATCKAAQKAFADMLELHPFLKDKNRIPIRPIVIGGDDFTVICRGDLAIDYVHSYLNHFEIETGEMLSGIGFPAMKLTACAGITFIKSSYPFYYGYNLAEELCKEAKKDAKSRKQGNLIPSCLMFHKVHDSYMSSYKDITYRELDLPDGASLKFGPYYLEPQNSYKGLNARWSIPMLLKATGSLEGETGNAIKADVRQLLNLMKNNPQAAVQKLERAKYVIGKDFPSSWFENLGEKDNRYPVYPVYDILSLHSVMELETK